MKKLFMILAVTCSLHSFANKNYWQQEVSYEMKIDVNTEKHQYAGTQKLVYTNNSPDVLDKVFYHLYFNAFQPGSMMDTRSLTIEDPDPRVGSRISELQPDEEGWIRVKSLTMNGKPVRYTEVGTILEVDLPTPIQPGKKVTFEMVWDAQVPLQIRRSGWNNKEGIEFSMSQWYPKMSEYDHMGWHSNPYVGREFHGVWGDFDVKITIDKDYVLGGTGLVVNGDEVGHGYGSEKARPKVINGKLTWHFEAKNVHDFVWAADPDYIHKQIQIENGPTMHFLYQDNPEFNENWEALPEYAVKAFEYMSEHFGKYPYPQYSIIQGGDGGMEYPMATLITGHRNLRSLVGVTVHEGAHSWYHGVLATNEALYEWMDEGFTSFATSLTMNELFPDPTRVPHVYAYQGYYGIVRDGKENALVTHADHYTTNRAYGVAAYSKGQVLVEQLGYIIGHDVRDQALLTYFDEWKFKHPTPNDFKRIMEKASGLELDWYFEYFMNSTNTIDYRIQEVRGMEDKVSVTLEKIGAMPMPLDVTVNFKDGRKEVHYIPLRIMRGEKADAKDWVLEEDWPWTHPSYVLDINASYSDISSIVIDESKKMADIDRSNNTVKMEEGVDFILKQ
ncbi:MAG: M1 family metallopeptidase [Flavobacteriales bacterium]|nr:M1 family metallopeptidase [Flavobacteriales bacterium]